MRKFSDICDELRKHPDYLAACIWQRADIAEAMEHVSWGDTVEWEMTEEQIWDNIRIDWWEDSACESGFEAIYMEMRSMGAYDYKEND